MVVAIFNRRKGNKPVRANKIKSRKAGSWQLAVYPPGKAPFDASFFRGLPTQFSNYGWSDPFGPDTFSFTMPGITIFDRIGYGDLAWLTKESNVDLRFNGAEAPPPELGYSRFAWEGYITSWDWGDNGLDISCAGAMHQVDLELAKPLYPSRPLPYEVAIANAFSSRPWLRLAPLKIEWPTWWPTFYTPPAPGTPSYLIPVGVSNGKPWTGLLTRGTGSWDQLLTSYVQGLLSSMYTDRGRWALDLDPGRQPVLRHRDTQYAPTDDDLLLDLAQPGITQALSEDWTQCLNVVYGSGTSLSGVGYSGMQVSPDGSTTTYVPLAALRQVDPVGDANGWYDRGRMRREVLLQVQPGLDEDQAAKVGNAHVQLFSDPGITGTIVVGSDPTVNGVVYPRQLLRAGMTVRLPKVFGDRNGPLLHITKNTYDFGTDQNTLTVDSKFRDALTVDEVRKRGRDALQISRMLVAGQYQPPISDQLLPWDYASGAGCIPSGPQLNSLRLFAGMPATLQFPWTAWTTTHPPKAAAWRDCYIHLSPASTIADKNWTGLIDSSGAVLGVPIKASQAGSIRLLQIAAYDADGNVLPVGFHFSLYYSRGVNPLSTPSMPEKSPDGLINYETVYAPYKAGQHFPFWPNAWETYNNDGTLISAGQVNATQSAGLIRAWGNSYEKAGFYPGSEAAGDAATGLLVDESQWSFDTTQFDASNFDPYSATDNLTNPLAGQLYAMIWCDQQTNQDVYFAGRMFRLEPGSTT